MEPRLYITLYLAAASVIFGVESDDVAQKIQNKRAEAEKRFQSWHPDVPEEDRTALVDKAWDTFHHHLNEHSHSDSLNTPAPEPEVE